jgi:nucleotide-binding universal stress UspA family protein
MKTMKLKKILVPVDFSKTSDKAVEYALFLAEKYGAKVTLFHAVVLLKEDVDEEEHLKAYETIIEKKEEKRRKYLKSHEAKGARLGVQIDSVLMRGMTPAETILNFIEEKKFDVLVMGTHGLSELMKWWLGSVAEKIVRYSPIPVITIHKDYKRKFAIRKVLFPVDFSEYSKMAVKKGMRFISQFDAKPTLMFVIEEQQHPFYYLESSKPILEANPALKEKLMKNLKAFAGSQKEKAAYHLVEGKPHKQIEAYADSKNMDLIIMASHGMSGLEHFLIGSNTERVVNVAPCPVLTIPVRSQQSP